MNKKFEADDAEKQTKEERTKIWTENCASIQELAEEIMTLRQSGVLVSQLFETIGHHEIAVDIIIKAYERPKYYGEELISTEIQNFKNASYLQCAKSYR